MGGFQSSSARALEIFTCREPQSRCAMSRLPSMAAAAMSTDSGTGTNRAGQFMARAIRRIKSGVDRSSPSLTKNVSFAAEGCSRHVTMKLTRLSMPTRLRRLLTEASGRGRPLATKRVSLPKLPGALRPCTRVGRMMTISIPVDFEIARSPTSASYLLTLYGSWGSGASFSEKAVPNGVEFPFTPMVLRKMNRRTPIAAAWRARLSVPSIFTRRNSASWSRVVSRLTSSWPRSRPLTPRP